MMNMRRDLRKKKGARKRHSRQGEARTHGHSTKGSRRCCASSSCRGSCVSVEFGLEVAMVRKSIIQSVDASVRFRVVEKMSRGGPGQQLRLVDGGSETCSTAAEIW